MSLSRNMGETEELEAELEEALLSSDTDSQAVEDVEDMVNYRIRGYSYMALVLSIWLAAGFVIQSIEESQVNSFAFTAISCSSFVLMLPYSLIKGNLTRTDSSIHWRSGYIALGLLPLWFGTNGFYNLSLCKTSVAASNILKANSAAFTLLLSS